MTKQDIDKLVAARKKDPNAGRYKLMKATGLSEGSVKAWMRGQGAPKVVPVVGKSKTLADFRNTYDKATIVPARVKAALKSLGAAGWEYEVAFVKLAGVSLMDLALFREQFAPYIVNLKDNKRAWAGSTKTATTMREML
jgi:hypothetical protein